MIYDIDGTPLESKIRLLMDKLDKIENIDLNIDKRLLKAFIIFHKVGLGVEEFQRDIRENKFPLGYEILSSYVLDRFLSKYHRHLESEVKTLLLKGVEIYPRMIYGAIGNPLEKLPDKVKFVEEAIDLLENTAIRYLGFKPLCRMILQRSWDKIVFIRWYSKTLAGNSISLYSRHKDYVDDKIHSLIKIIS
jgi:hypothetical protein